MERSVVSSARASAAAAASCTSSNRCSTAASIVELSLQSGIEGRLTSRLMSARSSSASATIRSCESLGCAVDAERELEQAVARLTAGLLLRRAPSSPRSSVASSETAASRVSS